MALKNGLFYENDELIYYKDGFPRNAGVIKVDGAIYCISYGGKARKGQCAVHRDMTNGILKRGTYTFGEDYKLVPGSYIAPKQVKRKMSKKDRDRHSVWERLLRAVYKERVFATLLVLVLIGGLILVANQNKNIILPKQKASASQNSDVTTTKTPVAENETTVETETVGKTENVAENETVAKNETVAQAAVWTGEGGNKVFLYPYTEDVLLCAKAAKMEYDGEITIREALAAGNPYRPVVFKYIFERCSGTLLLGEKADLSDAVQYDLPENQQRIEIHNLKVGTDYYYKVLVAGQEYLGSFHTAESTRYLYIPGLNNIRDIGGGTTQDGKRVKQGLLIRGPEMDGLTTVSCFITEEQGRQMQQEFGFVYDMDLRAAYIYAFEYNSKLGVPQNFYLAPQYGEIFNKNYSAALKRVFQDLAKPGNYPMYMHCNWGRDRTGTIIFLLQAVLNMSEEDMWQEFRRSAYTYSQMAVSEDMRVIIAGLEPYAGDTLQEKIVTFLTTEIGVTQQELDSIRSILLE